MHADHAYQHPGVPNMFQSPTTVHTVIHTLSDRLRQAGLRKELRASNIFFHPSRPMCGPYDVKGQTIDAEETMNNSLKV
eukprot:23161-Prymnesium_polylepis.1